MFTSAVRTPDSLSASPQWFVIGTKGLLVRVEDGRARLPSTLELTAIGVTTADALYLGRLTDDDCLAVHGSAEVGGEFEYRGLRSLFSVLDDELFAVAGRAVQIIDWDETHRFCGRCATPTIREDGERVRVCPSCGLRAYPRLAPAVIVLVHRGEQVLLARGARFPVAFYSTLAGFVEPGESLEETVAREIREEVGIEVANLRYFGSQPWPFPHSLMIGFNADYAGGEIQVDGTEILDAGWYSTDALPLVPPKLSIARQLIDAWIAARSPKTSP